MSTLIAIVNLSEKLQLVECWSIIDSPRLETSYRCMSLDPMPSPKLMKLPTYALFAATTHTACPWRLNGNTYSMHVNQELSFTPCHTLKSSELLSSMLLLCMHATSVHGKARYNSMHGTRAFATFLFSEHADVDTDL